MGIIFMAVMILMFPLIAAIWVDIIELLHLQSMYEHGRITFWEYYELYGNYWLKNTFVGFLNDRIAEKIHFSFF